MKLELISSFAETTASKYNPKMNRAMVLTALEGLKQIDSLIPISQFKKPTNIVAASHTPTTALAYSQQLKLYQRIS